MQPFVASTGCGQASLVTPKSVFMPASLVVADVCAPRQPAVPASRSATATRAVVRDREKGMAVLLLGWGGATGELVRERPRLPVAADAGPESEQPPWLE